MKRIYSLLVLLVLLKTTSAQPNSDTSRSLSLTDRIVISTQAFSALNNYFAHYMDVPTLKPDSVYSSFLNDFINTSDRYQFALLMKNFMGQFHNGHTWYRDKWLMRHYGQPLGFTFRYLDGKWVVLTSQITGLTPGSILSKIDTTSFESFFQNNRNYLNTGNERAARVVFSGDRDLYVFPLQFSLTTADGKQFRINRTINKVVEEKIVEGRWLQKNNIAYLRARHFNFMEEELLQNLEQFKEARAIIVDIRGYSGGATPSEFIDRLMDRPYRYYAEGTNLNMGLFQFYGKITDLFKGQLDTASQILYSGMKEYFGRASITWPANYIQPTKTIYKGKLFILVDGGVVSAKEDFVMPFKDNGRAIIIGEQTMGSTGQPYFFNFNADIQVAVGTKRAYFPDGSAFENKGITPDVIVAPTIADIKRGRDMVLEKALDLIK